MIPDYTLTLTPDELDELERILRAAEKELYIRVLTEERNPNRQAMRNQNALQNRIKGKFMDARRIAKEIKPRGDVNGNAD